MGFFDSLKKIFQNDSTESAKQQQIHCDELIRLISFAQKTKPLMGGNSGITVMYSSPNRKNNEYAAPIYAEFGFYDFNYIKFARRYAFDVRFDKSVDMVHFYYDSINKDAGITRDDWPYRMDKFDFARMLTNSTSHGFYELVPVNDDDDLFKIRIQAGFATQNGALICRLVEKECLKHYPNLKIKIHFAYPEQFRFTIQI